MSPPAETDGSKVPLRTALHVVAAADGGEDGRGGSASSRSLQTPCEAQAAEELPPARLLLVPMACIFQGYAAYVVCQRYLKAELNVGHTGEAEHLFTQSTVFMHYGKLVARIGHDVFFGCMSSWSRVVAAMGLVFIAVLIPPVFVWGLGSHWIGHAFLHYGLLGIGVGVFEGTFLSVISPLGAHTKAWAIMGCPLGLALVDILGQLGTSKETLDMNPVVIYWYIAVCLPLGLACFVWYAPHVGGIAHRQASILASLRAWRLWLPAMAPFFIAKAIGNFVMENTPGWFYVYNAPKVPMFSPSATTGLMDRDLYFVLIYLSVLLGDGISRRVVYLLPLDVFRRNVQVLCSAVLCSILGFLLESAVVASLTVVAAFLAFWGNGLGYGVATKYIDRFLPPEHSRAIYSLWCMVGDVGAIFGAATVDLVNTFFCRRHFAFECVL